MVTLFTASGHLDLNEAARSLDSVSITLPQLLSSANSLYIRLLEELHNTVFKNQAEDSLVASRRTDHPSRKLPQNPPGATREAARERYKDLVRRNGH